MLNHEDSIQMGNINNDDIPIIKIIDRWGYISQKKMIAEIHIVDSDRRLKRVGKMSRTKRGGYMFE